MQPSSSLQSQFLYTHQLGKTHYLYHLIPSWATLIFEIQQSNYTNPLYPVHWFNTLSSTTLSFRGFRARKILAKVALGFKLSHSSLALKHGGWRGWRDSPSQIQVCPQVCVCVCVWEREREFYLVSASSLNETPHLPSILQQPFMVTMVLIF